MNTTRTYIKPFFIWAIVLTFSIGALVSMTNIFGKSELSSLWKERFLDSQKMNAYTLKGLKAEISDAVIKDYMLKDLIFNNASFRNVEWTDTTSEKLTFTNTIFRSNTFNNVDIEAATFTNVTFEDSEFNNIKFSRSNLVGVKFIRCKFKFNSSFLNLKNSTVDFEYSTLENMDFARSNATLTFRDSTLNDVELTDLVFPSSLTFESSKLKDIDMSRSKLAKLVMENVSGALASNASTVAEVEVRNSTVGIGLNQGSLGRATFVNSQIDAEFQRSKVKEIHINNCKGMEEFSLYKSTVDSLNISSCTITKFEPLEAIIQNITIEKSSIVNSDFGDMKAKYFSLTDVTLDQKIDFTGAHVEHLTTKNVTKLPNLNLTLTNSNVKF